MACTQSTARFYIRLIIIISIYIVITIMLDYLNKLYAIFEKCVSDIDSKIIKRKSKINGRILMYYLMRLVGSSSESSITVASTLNNDDICDAKDSAFRKKRNSIPSSYVKSIATSLTRHYYGETTFAKKLFDKYRVLAVDGTYCPLSKNIEKDGFRLTNNNTYVSAPINGIYDVINNICIDLCVSTKSENDAYCKQLNQLKENDIVIHDRNYYSDKLAIKLNNLGIYYIFRIKKKSRFVQKLINDKSNDSTFYIKNNTGAQLRIIHYTVKDKSTNVNNDYFIATNLFNKDFTRDELKKLYRDRWNIEEYFIPFP